MSELRIPMNEKKDHSSTTSKSSKGEIIQNDNTSIILLSRSIDTLFSKNQSKYVTILKHDPSFNIHLYSPKTSQNRNKTSTQDGDFLMKQLDFLMEDECVLDKEINKIQFENQENQKLMEEGISHHMAHYMLLRNIWKREENEISNEERLQKLNKRVGHIKGHIKSMTKQESNSIVSVDRKKTILQAPEYTQLKQKYEQFLMRQEDSMANSLRETSNANQLKKKNKIIEQLQIENENLRQKYNEEKQKSRRLQNQIVAINLKMQDLEKDLLNKSKQMTKANRQNKYIYEGADKLTISITGSQIIGQSVSNIDKSFQQIHMFLIGKQLQRDKSLQQITCFDSFKNIERENDESMLKRSLKADRIGKQTPNKIRHIKGVYDLKSVDAKKPKFIRSNGLGNDLLNYKATLDKSKKRSINFMENYI